MKVWNLRKQKDIIFPDGVEKIGNHWFWDTEVESVTIPASVKEIGVNAFCSCKRLKRVAFAEGSRFEKFGAHCFSCSGLEEIVIPSSITMIESKAFSDCKNLKRVMFQEGSRLQEICGLCFESSGLEEFIAPPGLKEIDGGAFYLCGNLKRVVLNEGLEALNSYHTCYYPFCYGVFQGSGIEEITLPSTLKKIGSLTFRYCNKLKTIYVKSGCQVDIS